MSAGAPAPPDPVALAERLLEAAGDDDASALGRAADGLLAAGIEPALAQAARLLALGALAAAGEGSGDARRAGARAALAAARAAGGPGRRLRPIGVVRTPYAELAGMPLQTVAARGVRARVELLPELALAARDLDGFSHAWLITDLHRSSGFELEVVPFLDDARRSVLATRSPRRPNPLGLSLVSIVGVDGATIEIEEVDLLDGTPVLDVKPYVPLFDAREATRIGWFAQAAERVFETRSDARYGHAAPDA